MLRRQKEINRQIRKLFDAVLFVLSFWLAYLIRQHWKFAVLGGTENILPLERYAWIMFLIFPLGPLLLQWQGFYDRSLLLTRRIVVWQVSFTGACS